ncbi:hypothetical protein PPACK8108_LOCUS8192 [Phakopsora pachyrhizi]|uniref:Secreted protein n=1 Tax=Phakopsora pachyrhizi TaxID=170000 RepID=A0AAV0AWI5_PHAPC|nr:hypothetical protein PPACK8108_LOCUS8192 [Phakopsora pachyrhizi]
MEVLVLVLSLGIVLIVKTDGLRRRAMCGHANPTVDTRQIIREDRDRERARLGFQRDAKSSNKANQSRSKSGLVKNLEKRRERGRPTPTECWRESCGTDNERIEETG